MTGLCFLAAAVLFWVAWLFMPGVGVTDAEQILTLVSSQRSLVVWSVGVQLVSAVLYVPGCVGMIADADVRRAPAIRWGVGLMLVGAMGSAAHRRADRLTRGA